MGDAARNYGVGMQTFCVWEMVEGGRFDCVVFFPSLSRGRELVRDGWRLRAGEGARPFPGLYPLILLSHDAAGSRYANSDLAVALAGSGFIVIAPTHSGDNQNNSDALHTAELLLTRPRQILMALEAVLDSPVFGPYADASRIGMLGVGSGSVTALQLAGVRPDPGRMAAYCSSPAEDADLAADPFCTPWARSRIARLPADATALESQFGALAFTPPLDFKAQGPNALAAPVDSEEETRRNTRPEFAPWERFLAFFPLPESPGPFPGPKIFHSRSFSGVARPSLIPDFHGDPPFEDADPSLPYAYRLLPACFSQASAEDSVRPNEDPQPADLPASEDKQAVSPPPAGSRSLRALALLLPAGGMFFPQDAEIQTPALIIEAEEDGLYDPLRHSQPYLSLLPPETSVSRLAGADHFSLFAPCSAEVRENLAAACGGMKDAQRLEARKKRDGELIAFFQSVLGFPLDLAQPQELPPEPPAEKQSSAPPEAESAAAEDRAEDLDSDLP
jgi:predicted dienelactone hydrolase